MREIKKYNLRASRRPEVHPLLSGVVHVADHNGKSLSFIRFAESFVDAVGKALPQGLSPSRPAYLKVMHMPGRKTWRIFAMYLHEERGVLLWETEHPPSWIPHSLSN